MGSRVLVTGCSGYIGKHLCDYLRHWGYEVDGLDINFGASVDSFHHVDITDPFTIDKAYDAVVHLAALVRVNESQSIPTQYYQTNLTGTLNVLRGIKTSSFIFASTGQAELCGNAYSISKRAAEDVVHEYCSNSNMPYTIFRFYNVVGSAGHEPTNPDGLMYNLMKSATTKSFKIYGNTYNTKDGTCIRDYIHVVEVCEAIHRALIKPAQGIECLGHGVGYTVLEMVNLFQEINNVKLSVIFAPKRIGDIESCVLKTVSSYMPNMYNIAELLKLPVQPQA